MNIKSQHLTHSSMKSACSSRPVFWPTEHGEHYPYESYRKVDPIDFRLISFEIVFLELITLAPFQPSSLSQKNWRVPALRMGLSGASSSSSSRQMRLRVLIFLVRFLLESLSALSQQWGGPSSQMIESCIQFQGSNSKSTCSCQRSSIEVTLINSIIYSTCSLLSYCLLSLYLFHSVTYFSHFVSAQIESDLLRTAGRPPLQTAVQTFQSLPQSPAEASLQRPAGPPLLLSHCLYNQYVSKPMAI